jgi:hypothetical protein
VKLKKRSVVYHLSLQDVEHPIDLIASYNK